MLLAPPKSRGVGGFSFGFSSYSYSDINGGTGYVSGEKGGEEKKEDTSSTSAADFSFGASATTTPVVIASSGVDTPARGSSFRDAPTFSVMSLPNKDADTKVPLSLLTLLFGAAYLSSVATPTPHRLLS